MEEEVIAKEVTPNNGADEEVATIPPHGAKNEKQGRVSLDGFSDYSDYPPENVSELPPEDNWDVTSDNEVSMGPIAGRATVGSHMDVGVDSNVIGSVTNNPPGNHGGSEHLSSASPNTLFGDGLFSNLSPIENNMPSSLQDSGDPYDIMATNCNLTPRTVRSIKRGHNWKSGKSGSNLMTSTDNLAAGSPISNIVLHPRAATTSLRAPPPTLDTDEFLKECKNDSTQRTQASCNENHRSKWACIRRSSRNATPKT